MQTFKLSKATPSLPPSFSCSVSFSPGLTLSPLLFILLIKQHTNYCLIFNCYNTVICIFFFHSFSCIYFSAFCLVILKWSSAIIYRPTTFILYFSVSLFSSSHSLALSLSLCLPLCFVTFILHWD